MTKLTEWVEMAYSERDDDGRFDPTVEITRWRQHGENSHGQTIRMRIGDARRLHYLLESLLIRLDEGAQ